jgi:hypothetical protein
MKNNIFHNCKTQADRENQETNNKMYLGRGITALQDFFFGVTNFV